MCQQCVDSVKKYFPDLPEDDYGELLMGATAYPHASGEYLDNQLKDIAKQTDGSLGQALGYADYRLDMEVLKYKAQDKIKAQPFYL